MSNKLSSDGKFLPFRGWTVISPVRPSARPYGAALDESQAVWSSLLYSALHMIRTSSCASNFACLPEESLHTTITGLTDQQVGVKPADLRYSPWEEVEAELITRSMGHFTAERLGRLASSVASDAVASSTSSIHLVFKRIFVSSIISVELECLDEDMEKEMRDWKHSLTSACGFESASYSHAMPHHITLAYRTRPTGDHTKAETTLQKRLTSIFESLSSTASSASQHLILNPPIFACFPDMTEFPTSPLYLANQPLQFLLDGIHAASHTRIEKRRIGEELSIQQTYGATSALGSASNSAPTSASYYPSLSVASPCNATNRVCVIIVLGRALEGGKVTPTLENRLCRAFQAYMEAKHDPYWSKVLIIATGGYSDKGSELSEAHAMRDWLTKKFPGAIPSSDLIIEVDSLSTVENALFVRRMLISLFGFDSYVEHAISSSSQQSYTSSPQTSVQELRLQIITTSSHLGRSTFIFSNLLRLPHAQLEFIPCEDADNRDAAIETTKMSNDWAKLVARSLSFTSAFNYTSLLEMCKRNRIDDVILWMKEKVTAATATTSTTSTPLQSPAQSSKRSANATSSTTQQSHAQILAPWVNSMKDREGNSALHIATLFRRHRVVDLLLEQCGAKLSVKNATNRTPLDLAISDTPDVTLIKIFLQSIVSRPEQHLELADSSKGANGLHQKSEKSEKSEKSSSSSPIPFQLPDISTRAVRCDDFATLDALYLLFDMFHRPDAAPKSKSIFLFSITESWHRNLGKLKSLAKQHKLRVQDAKALVYIQEEKAGSSSSSGTGNSSFGTGSTPSTDTPISLYPSKSVRDSLLKCTSQSCIVQPTSTIVPFTSLEDVDTSLKELLSPTSSKPKTLFIFLLDPSPIAINTLLAHTYFSEKSDKQSDAQTAFVYKCIL